MPTPEEAARERIDAQLRAAGWVVRDRADFNRSEAVGIAVREFPLPGGAADYVLFIGGKAAGVIEAKPAGVPLVGVSEQSEKYMGRLPGHLARWADELLLDYEANGEEVQFRDMRDPDARSRMVFSFHRPETLLRSLEDGVTLRRRLTQMPPLMPADLRDCQVDAITGLEHSLSRSEPRALIQMATGAGKTFTACTFVYRLLAHAKAKRVLFLVDRNNLGKQALREFQAYRPPGTNAPFPALHNVVRLNAPRIPADAEVVISTIQRVYSALRGEEMDEEAEEGSAFERNDDAGAPVPIAYNPDIPIETFDVVIVDECHRSIYNLWRQVLEYFDAFVIGLTATPSLHTLGYFNQNVVAQYPYERSVVDGVNVGYEVYRIRTEIGERGATLPPGYTVPVRDQRTRRRRYETLDANLAYLPPDLDRSVTATNQIRTVLQTYRDTLSTDLFPGRREVPKTLIFAKSDSHAEDIVNIAREVFGRGNDFAKKITYRVTGIDPEELIRQFRNEFMPRIAVSVDMIATGTDIKPVESVIFMRDVRSDIYFEQMKGRGVRTINRDDLLKVTPDAGDGKTRFVLIDAVGVTESAKQASQPLERKRQISFDRLLDKVAEGDRDEDSLSSLAARLAALDRKIAPEDRNRIIEIAAGLELRQLAVALLTATDPDAIEAEAGGAMATDETRRVAASRLKDRACAPFDDPRLRSALKEIKAKSEIVIDDLTPDRTLEASFSIQQAEDITGRFRRFLDENQDQLVALQVLYNRPFAQQRLSYDAVRDLAEALKRPPHLLSPPEIWRAYQRLNPERVRRQPTEITLGDIVALVRYAIGRDADLGPFAVSVDQRFNLWIGRELNAGRAYNEAQSAWLRLIKAFVAANVAVELGDLQNIDTFAARGGVVAAREAFGDRLPAVLEELNAALVG
jgi:type I restriction enzyme R subunit